MPIGLDLDEVLAASLDIDIAWYNKEYNVNFTREDFTTKEYWNVWNISFEECCTRMEKFRDEYHLQPDSKPVKHAVQGVELLRKYDKLHIVSARPKQFQQITEDWVQKYFPGLIESVHLTGEFYFPNYTPKSEICKDLEIHSFIDDGINHMFEFDSVGIKSYLFDHSWNREEEAPKSTTRVHGWMSGTTQGYSIYELMKFGYFGERKN